MKCGRKLSGGNASIELQPGVKYWLLKNAGTGYLAGLSPENEATALKYLEIEKQSLAVEIKQHEAMT
jgi:hypothetical protein